MKKIYLILVTVFLIINLNAFFSGSEAYVEFNISSREEIAKITRITSIVRIEGNLVTANVIADELQTLSDLGYNCRILPSTYPENTAMSSDISLIQRDWDYYPTYEAYVDLMYQFQTDHPEICAVETIGYSIENREIIVARISDNVGTSENEPEFYYTGTMHGNELIGYINLLHLISYLLENYGVDDRITQLVNETEIYINPLSNPDGTYAGGNDTVLGATRRNANQVDLNRNFPDMLDGDHPDGNDWQPENIIQMDFADAHNIIMSANTHSGAEVINYPWDRIEDRHADDLWWQDVCHTYADTVQVYAPAGYLDGFDDGITNGYDWYSISGGRQDYMTYFKNGRETTMELADDNYIPPAQLPDYWEWNRRSMILYMEEMQYGIRGIVTDELGNPITVTVTIPDHDQDNSEVVSDPELGNYHRMLYPGVYDLVFSAFGHLDQIVEGITVTDNEIVVVDVVMPQAPLVDLTGLVYDIDTLEPVSEAYLELINTPIEGIFADPNGGYIFNNVPIGSYTVRVFSPEYEILFADIEVSEVNTVFDFAMTISTAESFENGEFPPAFSFSGSTDWIIDSSTAYHGVYSARSGDIENNQTTSILISANVSEPGEISFFKKVSCENGDNDNFDFLVFYIDGAERGRWDGFIEWSQESYVLSPGYHSFEWKFSKDNSVSSGEDCAWIDYISFPPAGSGEPVLSFDPDSFYIQLPTDELTQISLYLENTGEIGFDFFIERESTGIWLAEPNPSSGYLIPGASLTVETYIITYDLEEGIYEGQFILEYGLPAARETVYIPVTLEVISSDTDENLVPLRTSLTGNSPNPFNPSTTIFFELATPQETSLKIFNLKGEMIWVDNTLRQAGYYSVLWEGIDKRGIAVPSGIYFYNLQAGDYTRVRKMTLMK